ncbi:carbohydrate kinase family protein, partial [Escherichia coli]|nr:carbohydrate kinase family protein [Escherichia coli]
MMERKGIIAAGNMLVDHVHQIIQWPERGWLAEITHSERSTGGAPLNVLLTLAKMRTGLPLQAVGLIGQDSDGDYIMAMLEQYHVNRQHVQRTTFAPTSMSQVMTDPSGQRTFFHSPGANRLLDLPAFDQLDNTMKIFHLGYLLLLDSLDMPDDVYGTRSARLLAQMRDTGFETSLDLVSRKGDPRYQP